MKANFFVWLSLLITWTITACHQQPKAETPSEGTFVIEGVVEPQDGQIPPEGTKIWLVPFFGPHPRPVDSCFVSRDGSFRFEGNNELMAVIRLGHVARYGYQDLLVCTEPGHINVRISNNSMCQGTPLNDALQEWKDHVEAFNNSVAGYANACKNGMIDTTAYRIETTRLREESGAYVYQFLKSHGSNVMTRCLNTIRFGSLSVEQKAELNDLLKDTIDYTRPQPGFHR